MLIMISGRFTLNIIKNFKEKIMLVYKDNQEVLHCYEVEEKELVEQVKQCDDKDKVEQIFEDYIAKQNLNN